MDIRKRVKQELIKKENKRYEKLLARRTVTYEQWIGQREESEGKQPDASLTGEGKGVIADVFVMPGGRLAERATEQIAEYFATHPEVQILYGDEDVWAKEISGMEVSKRNAPWFKPDWSPDVFDSWYYFGSVVAIRREMVEKYPVPAASLSQKRQSQKECCIWQVREENHESFVNWIRKCLEAVESKKKGCVSVGHLSKILFHGDREEVLKKYMQWTTVKETEEYAKEQECKVSIIIPSKDNSKILRDCLQAIPKAAGALSFEIIIVDNGSDDTNKQRIEAMVQSFNEFSAQKKSSNVIMYIYEPMEFHFPKMCNLGAQKAHGRLLLFLNDDVELNQKGCLEKLAALAAREYTGAVGIKLLYPDSTKIQHAGITNLPMGPVHKLQFMDDKESYYYNSNRGLRNVLAVTAACLMVEKSKFEEVGGFEERLRIAFNDVDLCFKLYEQGYSNVCDNDSFAYHHESLSRGNDESLEKWERMQAERDILYTAHPKLVGWDPYYHEGLGKEGLDTGIRPAFETAGNEKQKVSARECKPLGAEKLSGCRQDNCLLVRLETCREGILQGYGVVLGDDNSCYDKMLLLKKQDDENSIYGIPIEGQYRPDLVRNMPDQVNVGLCGFWLSAENCLESGDYSVGITARNRVTGLQLINWANRVFTVKN